MVLKKAEISNTEELASFLEMMAADVRACNEGGDPLEIAEVSVRDVR